MKRLHLPPVYSIFYFDNADGSWTAKSPAWPKWKLTAPTLEEARKQSEPSLRQHVAETIKLSHYEHRSVA